MGFEPQSHSHNANILTTGQHTTYKYIYPNLNPSSSTSDRYKYPYIKLTWKKSISLFIPSSLGVSNNLSYQGTILNQTSKVWHLILYDTSLGKRGFLVASIFFLNIMNTSNIFLQEQFCYISILKLFVKFGWKQLLFLVSSLWIHRHKHFLIQMCMCIDFQTQNPCQSHNSSWWQILLIHHGSSSSPPTTDRLRKLIFPTNSSYRDIVQTTTVKCQNQ